MATHFCLPSDLTFYKAVEEKHLNTDLALQKPRMPPPTLPPSLLRRINSHILPDPTAVVSGQNNYFVQVAAVSKQEDAAALVYALKKKQYAAFAANTCRFMCRSAPSPTSRTPRAPVDS